MYQPYTGPNSSMVAGMNIAITIIVKVAINAARAVRLSAG
jgi:hypothetical protein